MRVLFILAEPVMHERMGVAYLGAALKRDGHEVRLAFAQRLGVAGLANLLHDYAPPVVAYSAMTGEHLVLLEVNRALKATHQFLAVFGGPHPTFFPDMVNEDGVDAVCVGEGDIAFPEFCRRVERGQAYWDTPNFAARRNGRVIRNQLLSLVEDLDALPFPDRELLYESDPDLIDEGHKVFFSARGCPYQCSYCFNRRYNEIYRGKGKVVRYRSPDNLIAEICSVRDRYPLDTVWIDDDTFLLKSRAWFDRFCALYKKQVRLPLSCNFRADLVTNEIVSALRGAGLDSVWMGVECGNEAVANAVLDRRLRNDQIVGASDIIKRHRVKLVTQNLIGLPVADAYRTDLETLDLNISIRPTFAWSSILFPYPQTPVQSYAEQRGFLQSDYRFLETNKRSSVLTFSTPREKRRVENLHKLFGLIVQFPFLRPLCTFLCDLPLSRLYTPLFYGLYGYNMKMRLYPFRSIRKELWKYIALWARFVRRK